MQNLEATIISQYANSPRLDQLIQNLNQYIDPTYNFDQFYDDVWNIVTANGVGLDILGRIVGVSRVLAITSADYFGFSQQVEAQPLSQAPLYNALTGGSLTTNVNLTDTAYRVLILAKSLFNLTNCSALSVNAILSFLFVNSVPGRTGQAYCTDIGDMQMTYTFNKLVPPLTSFELAIINQSGVLPRPAGVSVTTIQLH